MYFLFLFFFFVSQKVKIWIFRRLLWELMGQKKNKDAPLDNQSLLTGLCAVNQ
jgi:hypothetical protein